MALYEDFQKIKAAFEPMPFWFWNDDLEPEELRRQIRAMHARNIGGFFMHARMGRVTPYMSERWMECVKACVDEARTLGMQAWIYDEDNWPSGYGGGAICEMGRDYLQKYVFCHQIPLDPGGTMVDYPVSEGTLALFSATGDGTGSCHDPEYIPGPYPKDGKIERSRIRGNMLLAFVLEVYDKERFFCPECSTRGYVDVMKPEVIRAFIEHTYERYKRELGEDFGKTVPGFFTDEPNYHDNDWRAKSLRKPWTEALPDVYRERSGRELIQDLPSLFFSVGPCTKVRQEYYASITHLFVNSFTRQIYEWCEKNGVQLTGHFIVEEDLRGTCQTIGNALEHYEFEHMPGIDHLGKDIDLTDDFWSASRVLCKHVASVSRQLNRPRVMVETFAGGGWDFGPLEMKWMGDWMAALGVNLICPHAYHYSLRGYRKRDYPPCLGFQQPWFDYSQDLGAHNARLGNLLTQGDRQAEVAILHPLNSIRVTHRPQDFPWIWDPVHHSFQRFTEMLLSNQIDFDYLDETLLEKHGRLKRDRICLGSGEYKAVVIPHILTLKEPTLNLLKEFSDRGGKIVVAEPLPTMLDALDDSRPGEFLSRCTTLGQWDDPSIESRLIESIGDHIHRSIRVDTDDVHSRDIVYMHRSTEEGDIYFLASAAKCPFEARITFVAKKNSTPERWDTVTGERVPLKGKQTREGIQIHLDFDYGLSHLIVIPREGNKIEAPSRKKRAGGRILVRQGQSVKVRLNDPNVLLLDRCRARIGDGPWSEDMAVLDTNAWFRKQMKDSQDKRGMLEFRFHSRVPRVRQVFLLSETPNAFQFEINGRRIGKKTDKGWFRDPSLRKIVLSGGIEAGENMLRVSFDWAENLELEPFYIAGDFGIFLDIYGTWVIDNPVKNLALGSWTSQGLPFYTGTVTYRLKRRLRQIPSQNACLGFQQVRGVIHVQVNGSEAGTVLWAPFEVSIGKLLKEGDNHFEITVASSLRNFFGPHHLTREDDIDCLGPHNFFDRENYTKEYKLMPAGLVGDIRLVDPKG